MTIDLTALGWDAERAAYAERAAASTARAGWPGSTGASAPCSAPTARSGPAWAAAVLAAAARDPSALPCAGDWVLLAHLAGRAGSPWRRCCPGAPR